MEEIFEEITFLSSSCAFPSKMGEQCIQWFPNESHRMHFLRTPPYALSPRLHMVALTKLTQKETQE
jgi:hypothetical protein